MVVQGVLFNTPESMKTNTDMVRVWMHESARVYKDKLVDDADIATYDKVMKDTVKKSFEVCAFLYVIYVSH